jgi:hypothetical protein
MVSTIDDRFAGKQVYCPGCSSVIDVPAAAAPAKKEKGKAVAGKTRRWIGVAFGLLILATIFIPWNVRGEIPREHIDAELPPQTVQLGYSWQRLRDWWNGDDKAIAGYVVGLWVAGLAAVIAAVTWQRFPLAAAYIVLGGVGLTLLMLLAREGRVATVEQLRRLFAGKAGEVPAMDRSAWMWKPSWFAHAAVLVPAAFVVTSIRVRLRGWVPVNLLQLLVAVAAVLVLAVGTYAYVLQADGAYHQLQEHYESLREGHPSPDDLDIQHVLKVFEAFLPPLAFGVLTAAAAVMAFHGLLFLLRRAGLSRIALLWGQWSFWSVLLLMVAFPAVIKMPTAKGPALAQVGYTALQCNYHLMAVSVLLLCYEGMAGLLTDLIGLVRGGGNPKAAEPRASQPPAAAPARVAAPAPPKGPSERLAELDRLRSKGAISEEEYNATRDRILKEL